MEAVRIALARMQRVHLWPAYIKVPGIRVDLLDGDDAAEVDQNPAAVGAGVEEEILGRLILLRGDFAVVELVQVAAVAVPLAVNEGEHGLAGRVTLRWRRHVCELELGGGVLIAMMADNDLDLAARDSGKRQDSGDCCDKHHVRFHGALLC